MTKLGYELGQEADLRRNLFDHLPQSNAPRRVLIAG
jgi:hypothetical protein